MDARLPTPEFDGERQDEGPGRGRAIQRDGGGPGHLEHARHRGRDAAYAKAGVLTRQHVRASPFLPAVWEERMKGSALRQPGSNGERVKVCERASFYVIARDFLHRQESATTKPA